MIEQAAVENWCAENSRADSPLLDQRIQILCEHRENMCQTEVFLEFILFGKTLKHFFCILTEVNPEFRH